MNHVGVNKTFIRNNTKPGASKHCTCTTEMLLLM